MATAARGLGFPAVNTPRDFSLRSFQDTVGAVRERLRLLDATVTTLQQAVGGSSLGAQVVQMQQQLVSLNARITSLEGALGVNDTTQLIAAEQVEVGMPVVPFGADRCRIADPTDSTAIYGVVGLVQKAAAPGQAAVIQRRGVLSVQNTAFEIGRPVFAGADGELTQHPAYGTVALPVGVAVTTGAVFVAPGEPSLRVAGADPEFEPYMPATVQLVTDALDLAIQFGALPDGLFVKVGDDLMPRMLVEGPGIWIDNADGAAGNPTIRAVAADAVRALETAGAADSASAVLGP
jgi:hypothetical protein